MDTILEWVKKEPMIFIYLNKDESTRFNPNRGKISIVRPHNNLKDVEAPALCLIKAVPDEAAPHLTDFYHYGYKSFGDTLAFDMHQKKSFYCIAAVTNKMAVGTFASRLIIRGIHILKKEFDDQKMNSLLSDNCLNKKDVSKLTPKFSVNLIEALMGHSENRSALDDIFLNFLSQKVSDIEWQQESAINSAIKAFGIEDTKPEKVIIKKGRSSRLSLMENHIYEENIISKDASRLPGFNLVAKDVTGCATFKKEGERIFIYTANRLPLEEMFGVDLIYINDVRGNIVMVQYKMLEEHKRKGKASNWTFHLDKRVREQISRMRLPPFKGEINDYRLNSNPFFFKFAKRKAEQRTHVKSFIISVDHLKLIIENNKHSGRQENSVRIGYEELNGIYLRESDIYGLIRSGYVGTHQNMTESLRTIIHRVAGGDRGIVLAWSQKLEETVSSDVAASKFPIFEIKMKSINLLATAKQIGDKIVVQKESECKLESSEAKGNRKPSIHREKFDEYVRTGKIIKNPDGVKGILQEDVAFDKPSAAAVFVTGWLGANGRDCWKIKGTKVTYGEWEDSQDDKSS